MNLLNFFILIFLTVLFLLDVDQDIINAICDDDDIKAISFVGSNTVSYSSVLHFLNYFVYNACIYRYDHYLLL